MSEKLTPEIMKEWEGRLGPEKVQRAMAIARSNGWGTGTFPPIWVWATIYRMVEGDIPEQWGNSEPESISSIFGM